MDRKEYLFKRLDSVEIDLEEFESFYRSAEVLIQHCQDAISIEFYNTAEILLAELENIVIVFRQAKGE